MYRSTATVYAKFPATPEANISHLKLRTLENVEATNRNVFVTRSDPDIDKPAGGEKRHWVGGGPQGKVRFWVPVVKRALGVDEARQEVAMEILQHHPLIDSPPPARRAATSYAATLNSGDAERPLCAWNRPTSRSARKGRIENAAERERPAEAGCRGRPALRLQLCSNLARRSDSPTSFVRSRTRRRTR